PSHSRSPAHRQNRDFTLLLVPRRRVHPPARAGARLDDSMTSAANGRSCGLGELTMNLLFKREQVATPSGRINFKLWAKAEVTGEERLLIDKYNFHNAYLIEPSNPGLLRQAIIIGVVATFLGFIPSAMLFSRAPFNMFLTALGGIAIGLAAGW